MMVILAITEGPASAILVLQDHHRNMFVSVLNGTKASIVNVSNIFINI